MKASKNGRDEEYLPVVAALAPVLYNLPPEIIAIDGTRVLEKPRSAGFWRGGSTCR